MKKTEIIKKNYEFKYFFKKGEYISGKYIEIFIHRNKLDKNKLGIIVSKKVGNSVVRHRVRRLIKESYISLESEMSSNINMLICWKKKIEFDKNLSFFDIKKDLENVLKKAEILDNEENTNILNKNI